MMKKPPLLKIIAITWIIFSVLYIGYIQYTYLVGYIAKNSYEKGLSDAVTSVINQAQKCETFPIYVGEKKANLINTSCLQKSSVETKNTK